MDALWVGFGGVPVCIGIEMRNDTNTYLEADQWIFWALGLFVAVAVFDDEKEEVEP